MKRVKFACLAQTIHFELNEKLEHNEAVQQANLVRGEMRTRCVGYERRIRGYEENIQTMRRTIENLRAENERLRTQLGGAAHA